MMEAASLGESATHATETFGNILGWRPIQTNGVHKVRLFYHMQGRTVTSPGGKYNLRIPTCFGLLHVIPVPEFHMALLTVYGFTHVRSTFIIIGPFL